MQELIKQWLRQNDKGGHTHARMACGEFDYADVAELIEQYLTEHNHVKLISMDYLKAVDPGFQFASGVANEVGLHNSTVHWVAKTGGAYDWAIYYHTSPSVYEILTQGAKIHTESIIRRLVPCTDEAFKRYRF